MLNLYLIPETFGCVLVLPAIALLDVSTSSVHKGVCTIRMSQFQLGDPCLHHYEGVTYTQHFEAGVLDRIREHTFDPTDIIVASFPKSGTTWMNTILSLIFSDGKVADTAFNFLEIKRSQKCESNFDEELAKPAPHYLMTHLQFRFLEKCFTKTRPKVICVLRNPFDQLVSFYHFCKMNKGLGLYTGSWEEFYSDLYTQDKLCFGDYFEHVAGWWDARTAHADHILYVKYEDMIKDPRGALLKVASFLGRNLSESLIGEILEKTSFQSMRDNPDLNKDKAPHMLNTIVPFMRKGKVGDWKNFFTAEQTEEMMKLYREKIVSRGLEFDLELPSQSE